MTEKELTSGDEPRLALKIGLDRRLLPDRAERQEQTKSRQKPNPFAPHRRQVCPAILLLELSTHTKPPSESVRSSS